MSEPDYQAIIKEERKNAINLWLAALSMEFEQDEDTIAKVYLNVVEDLDDPDKMAMLIVQLAQFLAKMTKVAGSTDIGEAISMVTKIEAIMDQA